MLNALKGVGRALKNFIFKHKIISLIILLVLLGGGYWGYKFLTNADGVNRYVLAIATNGTIISSVSGTGQVSSLDQIDIKPEVSGKLVYLNLQKNKEVKAGTLLAQIDSRDAQDTVQVAENNLEGAQLSSQNITGDAKDALDVSYDGGLNALTNTFKDLASMKSNLDGLFLDSSYRGSDSDMNYYLDFVSFYDSSSSELSFWNKDAKLRYSDGQTKIETIEETAWTLSKNSPPSQIENIINESYTSTTTLLDLIRQALNIVQRYQKILDSKSLTTPITLTTTTTQATQLSDSITLLINDTSALASAKSDISVKKEAFSKAGVDTQSQNLSVQQYENALADAKDNLSKYYIYASIDGVVATLDSNIKTGDSISSGTVLGSIVTKQEIVETSLNEVDAVKIKLGQKATITFDALPDITVTGSVIDIDTVGTVSQGVVSYGVKVALDVINDQVKPGMSVSINIITDTRQNVLAVPNSAVKSKSGSYYVLVFNQKYDLSSATASQGFISTIAPTQKTVEIGSSDDTNTEITSGLVEGDQIVVRTISGTSTATSAGVSSSAETNRGGQGFFLGGPATGR